jgi:hypothetical protein
MTGFGCFFKLIFNIGLPGMVKPSLVFNLMLNNKAG